MERTSLTLIRVSSVALTFSLLWSGAWAGRLGIYWGQNALEPSLAETCASGHFAIVIIGFLTTFGYGRTPVLDLSGHCDPSSGGCQLLSIDIKLCQSKGVKVFLSLGGEKGNCALSSTEGAGNFGFYLWNNFLGGQSDNRPLGPAVLDGIDFNIRYTTSEHWDDLATALSARSTKDKKVYLSALPHCPPPTQSVEANTIQPAQLNALQTGLFDYVWIRFFNYPSCQYTDGNATSLLSAYKQWTTTIKTTQKESFFLGLPVSTKATYNGGFIPVDKLISYVLPQVKKYEQYGGVMLWNEFYDSTAQYSLAIKGSV